VFFDEPVDELTAIVTIPGVEQLVVERIQATGFRELLHPFIGIRIAIGMLKLIMPFSGSLLEFHKCNVKSVE
jgi:hypothetical protein